MVMLVLSLMQIRSRRELSTFRQPCCLVFRRTITKQRLYSASLAYEINHVKTVIHSYFLYGATLRSRISKSSQSWRSIPISSNAIFSFAELCRSLRKDRFLPLLSVGPLPESGRNVAVAAMQNFGESRSDRYLDNMTVFQAAS